MLRKTEPENNNNGEGMGESWPRSCIALASVVQKLAQMMAQKPSSCLALASLAQKQAQSGSKSDGDCGWEDSDDHDDDDGDDDGDDNPRIQPRGNVSKPHRARERVRGY